MKYVAFLRAINVGGHVVKMDALRGLFESMKFARVETFIASGNVIFESNSGDSGKLEKLIETKLRQELGYEVRTFLRTVDEIAEVALCKPFANPECTVYVGFLAAAPGPASRGKIEALSNSRDQLKVNKREIYWLCPTGMSESKISYVVLEKALQVQSTFRNLNTIQRLTKRFS